MVFQYSNYIVKEVGEKVLIYVYVIIMYFYVGFFVFD